MFDITTYNHKLNRQVAYFEAQNGDLLDYYLKQLVDMLHIMNLEDVFFNPDLLELEKYEKMLNGGNQTR